MRKRKWIQDIFMGPLSSIERRTHIPIIRPIIGVLDVLAFGFEVLYGIGSNQLRNVDRSERTNPTIGTPKVSRAIAPKRGKLDPRSRRPRKRQSLRCKPVLPGLSDIGIKGWRFGLGNDRDHESHQFEMRNCSRWYFHTGQNGSASDSADASAPSSLTTSAQSRCGSSSQALAL